MLMNIVSAARCQTSTYFAGISNFMEVVTMTEQEVTRGIRLVRYGGIVVTVTVFVVLVAFAVVTGNAIAGAGGELLNNMLVYIVGFTVLAAVLSIIVYFGYRAYLLRKLKEPKAS